MKQKFKKILSVLLIFTIGITAGYILFNKPEETSFNDEPKQIKEKNLLSYYVENENGEYVVSSGETWPTEGYKFNATLSRCENGGELGWDSEKSVVTMTGNMSDKCYIYFDKVLTLANYVKFLYTGTQGENNIYYHSGTIKSDSEFTVGSTTYPAETMLDANDGSYRYAGTSDDVNNYVCFGSDENTCPDDNKYRIIGVFGDQVKLIKADYANSNLLGTDGEYSVHINQKDIWSTYTGSFDDVNNYFWNNSTQTNIWSASRLNTTNLNTNFINNIGSTWSNKIAKTTWKIAGNTWSSIGEQVPKTVYTNEITSPDKGTYGTEETYSAKIGLMYASDYGFAASPSAWTTTLCKYDRSVNWMYLGIDEWTISRYADESSRAFIVRSEGYVGYSGVYYNEMYDFCLAVRPVFYLNSSVTYVSGTGTSTDPIIIN